MAVRLTARIAPPEPAGAVLRTAAADQGSGDAGPDDSGVKAPTAAQHTEILQTATAKVDKLEPRLASIIEKILVDYGDIAANKFTRWVTNPQSIVAAADWTAPFPDQLIDVDSLVAAILAKTDPVRNALIQEVMTPALEQAGLKWDIHNPLIAGQLASTGDKVTHIASTTRDNIMKIIGRAADSGLTIPQTSKLIQEGMRSAAASRATMIARTELGRAVNGASLTATQMVSKETKQTYQKVWLTAPGAKWPRHEDYDGLDGQTVNLNDFFSVGTAEMQFPGDPDGPPDETIMCRCALSYADVGVPGTIVLPDGTVIGTPTEAAETAIPDNPLHAPLSPIQGKNATGLARSLRVQAKKIEPAISDSMKGTAKRTGANLAGFKFRLKGEKSLTRKIAEDAQTDGVTEAETARKIADTVRYTAEFSPENYVEGSRAFLNDLEQQGYKVGKFKNTWQPDVPYAGINTNIVAPNGYKFELQFHTPDSFELKNFVNHPLYEEWRLLDPESERALQLDREMTANTRLVPVPQGARTFQYEPGRGPAVPSLHGEPEPGKAFAPGGPGGPGSVVSFSETTDYRAFNEALGENARPGFLTVHTPEELADNRVFLSADGKAGFSITPARDLQNVFRNEGGVKGAGRMAVHQAVQDGGARTLDAYDGFLPDLYTKEGFEQVGRMTWNDEFAPDGWNYEEYGRPDVVFMATNPVEGTEIRTFTDFDEAKTYSLEVSRPIEGAVSSPAEFVTKDLDTYQAHAAETAHDAIAQVVDIPSPVTFTHLAEDDTATARSLSDGRIGIAPDTSSPQLVNDITHEYGHWLDRNLLGPDDYNVPDSLFQVMKNSPTMKAVRNDEYEILKGDTAMRNYFLQGREMFARAFDQYVSEQSGNAEMLANIDKVLADQYGSFQYWPHDEFKPIAEEMTKTLRDHGLLEVAKEPPPLLTGQAATEALDARYAEWGSQLTADEKKAVQVWRTETGYDRINTSLRTPGPPAPEVATLDKVIASAPTLGNDTQVIAFRGVEDLRASLGPDVRVGSIVRDPGFQSATTVRGVAEDYSGYTRKGGIIQIQLPADDRAVWMRSTGLENDHGGSEYYAAGENHELLLARDQSYEVVSVSRDEYFPVVTLRPTGELPTVPVEVPPPAPKPLPAIKPPSDAALGAIAKQADRWDAVMNGNEAESVRIYTGSAYRAINEAVRGNLSDTEFRDEFGQMTQAAAQDFARNISTALDKAPPMPEGVPIYRGLNPFNVPDLRAEWEKLGTPEAHAAGDYRDRFDPDTLDKMVGDWLDQHGIVEGADIQPAGGGFNSFSAEPGAAARWGSDPNRPGIVFRVANPTHGVSVNAVTTVKTEKEILVADHATYRVASITREDIADNIKQARPGGGSEYPVYRPFVVNLEEVPAQEFLLSDTAIPARVATDVNEAARAMMDGVRSNELAAGKTPDPAALKQGVKNWTKNLKDVIVTDPAAIQRVQEADAYNMANPIYASKVGGRDTVIIIKDDTPFDNPIRPGGPATAAGRITGNQATAILEEATKIERTGASVPGDVSSIERGGVSALLRHEYGHSVSDAMTQKESVAFRAKLPNVEQVKKDVTIYATKGLDTGNIQEAYSELFSITTDPAYRPSDWAPWVQDIGHETWGAPLAAERPTVEALITKSPTELVENLTPDLDTTGKEIDRALSSISDVIQMPEPQPYDIPDIGTVKPQPLTAKITGDIHVEGLPPGSKVQGTFEPTTNSIKVRRLTDDPRSVFTHEFGHALDQSLGDFEETLGPDGKLVSVKMHATSQIEKAGLDGWAKAVTESPTYKNIHESLLDGFARAEKAGLTPMGTDVVYVSGEPYYASNLIYAVNPAEMWARTFTQYMSQTDEHIAAHVAEKLGQQHQDPGMWYWPPDEFAPIAEAMTQFFRDKGLLVEPTEAAAEAEPSELLTHAVAEGAAEQTQPAPPQQQQPTG